MRVVLRLLFVTSSISSSTWLSKLSFFILIESEFQVFQLFLIFSAFADGFLSFLICFSNAICRALWIAWILSQRVSIFLFSSSNFTSVRALISSTIALFCFFGPMISNRSGANRMLIYILNSNYIIQEKSCIIYVTKCNVLFWFYLYKLEFINLPDWTSYWNGCL